MDALGGLAEAAADRPALGGAKRGLGAEAPCWLVFAFAENCQHEAAAPRPRFAALRLRVRPCRDALQGRDRGSRRGLSEATSNSQHEAEAPRPRFAASRLRVRPCRDALQGRDRGSRRGLSEATSNSQHEAEAPRPRFAASRLRVRPCRDRGASARDGDKAQTASTERRPPSELFTRSICCCLEFCGLGEAAYNEPTNGSYFRKPRTKSYS